LTCCSRGVLLCVDYVVCCQDGSLFIFSGFYK
jgi:hypothetical protein